MSQSSILIVDDNQDLADGLGMVLVDEDYQVTLAYNGVDAISKFNTGDFDVVLIDVKLPDMKGVELFQYIHEKDSNAKVIMMTGFRIEQVLAEVIENGDVKILRKPIEIKHVLDTLNKIRKESIILVEDDDPGFSEAMSEFLNEQGMKTILAKNTQEALDGVLSNPVDILVLDLQVSIMCGLDVYLNLKKKGHAVKTIIVTGHEKQETETIDILKSLSVTGCLFKPFNPNEMLNAIEKLILC